MPVVAASILPRLQQAMHSNCRVASAAPCLCLQFHLLPGVPREHWCALAVVACVALQLLAACSGPRSATALMAADVVMDWVALLLALQLLAQESCLPAQEVYQPATAHAMSHIDGTAYIGNTVDTIRHPSALMRTWQ